MQTTRLLFIILLTGIPVSESRANDPGQAVKRNVEAMADDGNIFVTSDSERRQLTFAGTDFDPVVDPGQSFVVFNRMATGTGSCPSLYRIEIDGSAERRLLEAKPDSDVKAQYCEVSNKQFSSDGLNLFFETPAWAVSDALHVYDFQSGAERYVQPSIGYVVLDNCEGEHYRNHLAIRQHRYFVFAGSYDWWWLFSPDGRKKIGPIGDELLCDQ